MSRNNNKSILLSLGMIIIFLLFLSACGRFGGRYKITTKSMNEFSSNKKIPINVKLVLDSELCNYVYISKRQGAKRVYELGEALCSNTENLFKTLFKNAYVVSGKPDNAQDHVDVIVTPKVIDTSVLVRPGAPPNFEATLVYECAMEDTNGRVIFLRTVKENKVIEQYVHDGYKVVMQETVDELFTKLEIELVDSPEIKKFAKGFK
ncbi:hypothetical protein KJ855_00745 [Patescibacteria group bacterium]|nr:hypothetical protein [Patescibacteria group bacterium]